MTQEYDAIIWSRIENKIDDLIETVNCVKVKIAHFEELVPSINRRVTAIEDTQDTTGCVTLRTIIERREGQIGALNTIIIRLDKMLEAHEARIKAIEDKPLKAMDKFGMAVIGALGAGFGGGLMIMFKKLGL
jgi:hypothetical protein